jgi:hypothetical protein
MYTLKTMDGRTFTWKLGETKPEIHMEPNELFIVKSLHATGVEYSRIATDLSGIPKRKDGTQCLWRSTWAQFIYDNM